MPWSSTRTSRSRPEAVRTQSLLRACAYACEGLERRLLLTAGVTFVNAPAYTETGGVSSAWRAAVGRFNNDAYPDLVVVVTPLGYP